MTKKKNFSSLISQVNKIYIKKLLEYNEMIQQQVENKK